MHHDRNGLRLETSPYMALDRSVWSGLSSATPQPLTEDDVERLRGLGEPIDVAEVADIYRPLSRLLALYVAKSQQLHSAVSTFLDREPRRTPFVLGIAGSVAVGKSTTARILRELLARWPETPRVELITTDGFLWPNAELERRGMMNRKGFPESYDRAALLRFLSAVKSGQEEVRAPVYSHLTYDIVPGAEAVIRRPDVLIVEGLNVLQPARMTSAGKASLAVSDFFDFSIYVDARTTDIAKWYVDRFLTLRRTAFTDPNSYFRSVTDLTVDQAIDMATGLWRSINERNLNENILPTRGRATLILRKSADHSISRVLLRKV